MLKISSAAADSRLLTRALISSALNILAEDSGGRPVRVRPRKSASVEPGAAALSWMEQISRDHQRPRPQPN